MKTSIFTVSSSHSFLSSHHSGRPKMLGSASQNLTRPSSCSFSAIVSHELHIEPAHSQSSRKSLQVARPTILILGKKTLCRANLRMLSQCAGDVQVGNFIAYGFSQAKVVAYCVLPRELKAAQHARRSPAESTVVTASSPEIPTISCMAL